MVNIFRLHDDADVAAEQHCDQHIMSGIHETGLMLSAALREHAGYEHEDFVALGIDPDDVYGHSHKGHPLNEWLAHQGNWEWGLDYAQALFDEKVHRWGGGHRTFENFIAFLPRDVESFDAGTTRMYCAVDESVEVESVPVTYRQYYIETKGGVDGWMKWQKNREPPEWLVREDPYHGLSTDASRQPVPSDD